MFGRRKRQEEFLPWYRAPTYKGALSEEDKRILDSIRMRSEHPATLSDNLPSEAQAYINRLEVEAYSDRQDRLVERAILVACIGGTMLYLNHFGWEASRATIGYVVGTIVLIGSYLAYRHKWNRNANEFVPPVDSTAPNATDEALREEWELEYITQVRIARRNGE